MGLLDLGIDPEELQRFMQQMGPSEDERRSARTMGLLSAGLGMLAAPRNNQWGGIANAVGGGFAAQQGALQNAQAQRMQALQAYGSMMDLSQKAQAMKDQQAMRGVAQQSMTPGMPEMGPPTAQGEMQPPVAPQLDMNRYMQNLPTAGPAGINEALRLRQAMAKDSPFSKIDPKDFTQDSVLAFMKAGGGPEAMALLVPRVKKDMVNIGGSVVPVDPYAATNPIPTTVGPDALLSSGTTMRGQDITARGQNMSDQRARDAMAQAAQFHKDSMGQPVFDPGVGAWVTRPSNGQSQAIPVAGLPDKPLTEVQGNATAFGMRANAANQIFGQLESTGAPVGGLESLLAKSRVTNAAAPEWAQKAYQAKLNFMSATLRKESGAAISPSEYEAEDKKYFPQVGDKPETIAQKSAMRDLAIKTLTVQAGPGKKEIGAAAAPRAGGPAPGTVVSGFRFKGGNPNDRANWEHQ